MNYQDTQEQADVKLQKTLMFLKQYHLPADPVNYTVAYEYVSGQNTNLIDTLNADLKAGRKIDSFLLESLYRQHVLVHDNGSERVYNQARSIVDLTTSQSRKSEHHCRQYMSVLDEGLLLLNPDDIQASRLMVDKLIKATKFAKSTQQALLAALKEAKAKADDLQDQIEDLNQQKQLDSLTGLYNRSVLNQTVDVWLQEKTSRIAALAINLDHFRQFNDNFGYTIGNVILSKIAQKVKSYVQESGLPVRLSGEEFLVMLPDIDVQSAKEIAEKVRHGVEKMQFVNARNKQKLPRVTVSIGVAQYTSKLGLDGTISKAAAALQMAKATGRNRVYSDN